MLYITCCLIADHLRKVPSVGRMGGAVTQHLETGGLILALSTRATKTYAAFNPI